MRGSTAKLLATLVCIVSVAGRHKHCLAQPRRVNAVVVLILENRSFDHMLGWMKKSIAPSIDGLDGSECNPTSTTDPSSPLICVSDDAHLVDPDPGHSFQAVRDQLFGLAAAATAGAATASMLGFVEQALTMSLDTSTAVMKGFNPSRIPVYSTLVQEFAVFDRWFSALPGPTQPNRLFAYSATSHGAISQDAEKILWGFPQKTIFDSLQEDGLDFGIYCQSFPSTLLYQSLRRLKYVVSKFHVFETFKEHAREGRLPVLSVVEPRYFDLLEAPANDDHPSHDVAEGQRLVKEVYESLRSSPQWNESLLIITYDEHGGFYDHVPPPESGVPSPDGIPGPPPFFFAFNQLGVRVPTIMVSPWIKKGTVVNKPKGPYPESEFEHSSIPATLKKMFNLSSNFLTKRDAWAGTFESILQNLESPRTDCPEVLPDVLDMRETLPEENRTLSDFQMELVDLAAALYDKPVDSTNRLGKKMTVRMADEYVKGALSSFLQASERAVMLGTNEDSTVDLTTLPLT